MTTAETFDQIVALAEQLHTHAGTAPTHAEVCRDAVAMLASSNAQALIADGDLQQAARLLDEATAHAVSPERREGVGAAWLALAKAWGRQRALAHAPQIEHALRRAVDLAPTRALAALARFLEQQERGDEAMDCWRVALRHHPQDSTAYSGLARLQEQRCDVEGALDTYLALIASAPTAINYLTAAKKIDALPLPSAHMHRSVRIALIGNATFDHLQSYLKVFCYQAGLRPQIYQAPFDQYAQEILDTGSDLYMFAPDVVICAIHASRLVPTIHDYPFDLPVDQRYAEIERALALVETLLTTLTRHTTATALLHTMVAPQHPALGIADLRDEHGQSALFAHLNGRLADLVRRRFPNVYLLDEDRVQAQYGKAQATDPRMWLAARMGWSHSMLEGLSREYLRFLRPLTALGRKCIVLDLDNTLWGGVVGEDGIDGIQLGSDAPGNAFVAFQRELERLWKRGILLTVVSKNNPEDALAVFERHPDIVLTLRHFAAWRINWAEKADNIREIARELNIGLDSMVFLDDNPVERAKVRAELPQVLTPDLPTDPAQYRGALLRLDVFESLGVTDEDRARNRQYVEQRERRAFEEQHQRSGSVEDYLAALEMVVEIAPADSLTEPRIAQLTSKTNQFNLTTRRYTEAQIRAMQQNGAQIYGMRVRDRFGDNGLVGVVIVTSPTPHTWEIDTLLLSCRVMGRGVETALLAFVADQARTHGIIALDGSFIPTAKNAPARECYPSHGFQLIETSADGGEHWRLAVGATTISTPPWLNVHTPASHL